MKKVVYSIRKVKGNFDEKISGLGFLKFVCAKSIIQILWKALSVCYTKTDYVIGATTRTSRKPQFLKIRAYV